MTEAENDYRETARNKSGTFLGYELSRQARTQIHGHSCHEATRNV